MPLISTPDLGSRRRVLGVAVVVVLCIWVLRSLIQSDITAALGDTDDALRLVRVRELLGGQGWYDQVMVRLQPPVGSMMHWSRLLDAALAGVDWLFGRFLAPADAEWAMRFFWPMLWIPPAVVSVLAIVGRIGTRSAVLVAAVLMVVDVQLYNQFRPGRIDHHNVQIVMVLIAAACATAGQDRPRWAALGGVATALGLAVGIEALVFHAVIGAGYALRAGLDRAAARSARAYGLALATASLALFAAQTPPPLWGAVACDAMAWNLILALAIGGYGLAAATWAPTTSIRLGAVGLVGIAAAAAYVAADPGCIHGPMAAADPRLLPIWLDKVRELRSWPQLWRADRDMALESFAAVGLDAAAAAYLVWRRRNDPAVLVMAVLVAMAGVAASQAVRMMDYAFWFGAPVIGAALGDLVERRLHGALVGALAAGVLLAPQSIALASARVADTVAPLPKSANQDSRPDPCTKTKAYARLARLPPGIVLAPIDLGPFILAHTPSSALAAPYHRMTWGILAAHDALNATSAQAQAKVRSLNVRYVVECRAYVSDLQPTSLEADLKMGRMPDWLTRLSGPKETLQIYRVAQPDGRQAH